MVLQISLFVLIRRYRRIEKLEGLFLTLIACLFLWNSCRFLLLVFKVAFRPLNTILLELGVGLTSFCILALLPSLLLHTHLVFQQRFTDPPSARIHWVSEIVVYLPLLLLPSALLGFTQDSDTSILASTRRLVCPLARHICIP